MRNAIEKVDLSLSVDSDEFYRMYNIYQSLKDCSCKICTVCGCRQQVETLKDAACFFDTLEVSNENAENFNSLLTYTSDATFKFDLALQKL